MIKSIPLTPVQLEQFNKVHSKRNRLQELLKEVEDQESQLCSFVMDASGITEVPQRVEVLNGNMVFTFEDKKE